MKGRKLKLDGHYLHKGLLLRLTKVLGFQVDYDSW